MAAVTIGLRTAATKAWTDVGKGNSLTAGHGSPFVVPAGQAGFVTHLGCVVRRDVNADKAWVALALYGQSAADASKPGPLLGYTGWVSVTVKQQNANGQVVESPLAYGPGGASLAQKPVLAAGQRFFVRVINRDKSDGAIHLLRDASRSAQPHFTRSGAPPLPEDFGSPNATTSQAPASVWIVAETGSAPALTPTGPLATISTGSPRLTATVADADAVAFNDYPTRASVQVRVQGAAAVLWSTDRVTSSAERSGRRIDVAYAGPALVPGVQYEWRGTALDRTNKWAAWTAWRPFMLTGVGDVDISASTPAGKQATGAVVTWGGRWTSASGLSMVAAKVRLYDEMGRLLKEGNEVAFSPAVGPLGLFTMTGAQAGLGGPTTPLPPGSYQYEVLGKDTGGGWSLADGPLKAFSVNSPPDIPSGLEPWSGSIVADRPLLTWRMADPDPDDSIGASVNAQIEFERPGGAVVYASGIVNVDPDTGLMFFQTTSAQLPNGAYGDYTWRVRGADSSGAVSDWSTPNTFRWQPSPAPTITSPAALSTVATKRPTFTWTVAFGPQTAFELSLFRPNTTVPFFSSGRAPASGTSGSYTTPDGWLSNRQDYDAVLTVFAGELAGTSQRLRFRVLYPAADTLIDAVGSLDTTLYGWEPHVPALAWERTNLPPERFAGYMVYRRLDGQTFEEATPLAKLANPDDTAWRDWASPPNRDVVYAITQLEDVGGSIRESDPVEVTIFTALTVPTLTALADPARLTAALRSIEGSFGGSFRRAQTSHATWGTGGAPTVIQAPEGYGQALRTATVTVIGEGRMGVHVPMLDLFGQLWETVNAPGVLVARFPDGERLFCAHDGEPSWSMGGKQGTRQMAIKLQQVAHVEAIRRPD